MIRHTMARRGCIAAVTLIGLVAGHAAAADLVIDRDNIVISESVTIRPGTYRVPDADGNGVLQVRADNVVIDFKGATLCAGDPAKMDLTQATGVGIAIDGAKGVTIRNANICGYMFNIRASDAPKLRLEDCDASRSRAQRIAVGDQPVEIWLVLRDLAAWRSYGAGIWIERSDGCEIHRCRAGNAQNGLLLVGSSGGNVRDCDFSFNSGFGVGLWASSGNVVAWNRIDFVNRPWGGGWGGDSAGFVVVNGSNENYIVGNSFTHGGDGFFLTDRVNGGLNGQTQTSNIQGACDRNIVAYNDGSWSPHNAFEGTFSKGNVYYKNLANDSGYGFWLGFSDDSLLLENEIQRIQAEGIAIEHGSGTRIEGNTFVAVRGAAVALWSSADWVDRVHPSRDLDIRNNVFRLCSRDFRLDHSTQVSVGGNRLEKTPAATFDFTDRPSTNALADFRKSEAYKRLQKIVAERPKGFVMYRDGPGPKGLDWLQADEYAPRDYRNKLVAWRRIDEATIELWPLTKAPLTVDAPEWMTVSRDAATKAYRVAAKPSSGAGESRTYEIRISAVGESATQTIEGTVMTGAWEVRWYRWDQPKVLAYDDAKGWAKLFESDPLHRQTAHLLSAALWERGFPPNVPNSYFAIVATTELKLPKGRHRFSTVSDDGLRVFLDGKEIISRWDHHGPTPDEVEVDVADGVHKVEVHYCQETGAWALTLGWTRVGD